MLIDSSNQETRARLDLDALPPYGVKPLPQGDHAVYVVWHFPSDTPVSSPYSDSFYADRSEAFRHMDRLNAVAAARLKVFKMDDCTWYAGTSAEEVRRAYLSECGIEEGGIFDQPPAELTAEAMARLKFYPDPYDRPEEWMPFRDALARMLAERREFPCFFATSEF